MRVLFMGTPDFAAASLEKLYSGGFDICGVFTQPDKPKNRGMKLVQSPVKTLALQHGTPVFQPASLRDGTALEIIKKLEPELIAVVAYGKILPEEMLNYPKFGCINIHGSILPKYRGSAPIQWAVLNGEEVTGVTAMYMAKEMDSGDIIAIEETCIRKGETSGELFDRLMVIGGELLCRTILSVENGTVTRTPQDHSKATFAPPIKKELCPIDWSREGHDILNKIRGLNPWPVATFELDGTVFKAYSAEFISDGGASKADLGTVKFADDRGLGVKCADGIVIIKELQVPGKKRMSAADYLRGHPICH